MDVQGDSISIKNYFDKWIQFEYRDRNNAMGNNVIRTINHFPEKQKFIVLTGLSHRLPIKKVILNSDLDIQVKEFYE